MPSPMGREGHREEEKEEEEKEDGGEGIECGGR